MSTPSFPSRAARLPRRAFLQYSGATALAGGLALAGCKKDDDSVTPTSPVPTLAQLAPDAGPVGTVVTLTGTNFTGATRVTFGGVAATSVTVDSPSQITATVPVGATSGPVQVTTPNGVGTSPGAFTLQALMAGTLTGFTPAGGRAGTVVTLTGTGFTNTTAVAFGGVAAPTFTVVSNTRITVTVPLGAAAGPITVTAPGGVITSATPFAPLIEIAGFTPPSGPAGTVVTLTGVGFTGATAVAFGGVAAPIFTVDSDTSITVTVPTGADVAPITVTAPAGTVTSTALYSPLTTTLTNDDIGLLNYAYLLEQLEAAFYTKVVADAASLFSTSELGVLQAIRDHEVIHREFFKATLGPNRLIDLTFDFAANGNAALAVNFSSKASILAAARLFEDTGVQACNGAARYFQSVDYLLLVGKIVTVEARHAALLRDMIEPNSFAASTAMGSVPAALDAQGLDMRRRPSEVLSVVLPFVQNGAQLISQLP